MRAIAPLALGLLLLAATPAGAQPRPTSGDISVHSGRTVGNGEVVLAAGLGWPGFWAEALFAPSSRFNLSVRVGVDYGSPLLGFATGVGGEVSLPMRLLVYGEDDIDIALALRPYGVMGEGALVGQENAFADDLGWAVGAEGGVRAGFHVTDAVTLVGGALLDVAYVDVPDAERSNGVMFGAGALAGLEALLSRSTLLFVVLKAGYGLGPENAFDSRALFRASFGLAYRL